jgi:hypothetical protein
MTEIPDEYVGLAYEGYLVVEGALDSESPLYTEESEAEDWVKAEVAKLEAEKVKCWQIYLHSVLVTEDSIEADQFITDHRPYAESKENGF